MADFPHLLHTVIDAREPRLVAEFWRELLGLSYRPGDEPPGDGPDDADWLVLTRADGTRVLAVQLDEDLEPTTWPGGQVSMQMHLDLTVPDRASLIRHHRRAMDLGAREILDRTEDPDEPLWVLADPAGHPFCIFVG